MPPRRLTRQSTAAARQSIDAGAPASPTAPSASTNVNTTAAVDTTTPRHAHGRRAAAARAAKNIDMQMESEEDNDEMDMDIDEDDAPSNTTNTNTNTNSKATTTKQASSEEPDEQPRVSTSQRQSRAARARARVVVDEENEEEDDGAGAAPGKGFAVDVDADADGEAEIDVEGDSPVARRTAAKANAKFPSASLPTSSGAKPSSSTTKDPVIPISSSKAAPAGLKIKLKFSGQSNAVGSSNATSGTATPIEADGEVYVDADGVPGEDAEVVEVGTRMATVQVRGRGGKVSPRKRGGVSTTHGPRALRGPTRPRRGRPTEEDLESEEDDDLESEDDDDDDDDSENDDENDEDNEDEDEDGDSEDEEDLDPSTYVSEEDVESVSTPGVASRGVRGAKARVVSKGKGKGIAKVGKAAKAKAKGKGTGRGGEKGKGKERLLTTRQAVLASMVDSSHVSLDQISSSRSKKQPLSEMELKLRREETARKRKNLSEKKLEDEKADTINRLLKKQTKPRARRANTGTTVDSPLPGSSTPTRRFASRAGPLRAGAGAKKKVRTEDDGEGEEGGEGEGDEEDGDGEEGQEGGWDEVPEKAIVPVMYRWISRVEEVGEGLGVAVDGKPKEKKMVLSFSVPHSLLPAHLQPPSGDASVSGDAAKMDVDGNHTAHPSTNAQLSTPAVTNTPQGQANANVTEQTEVPGRGPGMCAIEGCGLARKYRLVKNWTIGACGIAHLKELETRY